MWGKQAKNCLHNISNSNYVQIPNYSQDAMFLDFNVHGSVHLKNIPIYIQPDATLHSLFYPETALHVSGGTSTHHHEYKQLYLQHLMFVTPLLLSAAIVEELEVF